MRWNNKQKRIQRDSATGPAYKNPLFTKKNWQAFIVERFSFFSLALLLFFLVLVYIFLYSPLFAITSVTINGASDSNALYIKDKIVEWQAAQTKWLIFRQSNILLFSSSWLKDNINSYLNPESVDIDKQLPHTLSITIKERQPTFIWSTDQSFYYLGLSGVIATEISNIDEAPALPALYDESNQPVRAAEQVLSEDKMQAIQSIIDSLNEIETVTYTTFSMPHRLSLRLNVHTENGYLIYFDVSENIQTQIEKLNRVLTDTVPNTPPQEYIDLRIGERVYLK